MENRRVAGMSALFVGAILMGFATLEFDALNAIIAGGFIIGMIVFIAGMFLAFGD